MLQVKFDEKNICFYGKNKITGIKFPILQQKSMTSAQKQDILSQYDQKLLSKSCSLVKFVILIFEKVLI